MSNKKDGEDVPHGADKEMGYDNLKKDSPDLDEAAMDEELQRLEHDLQGQKLEGHLFTFAKPEFFTYVLVGFASLGGLLSGLDQSLISGANIDMPTDLNLDPNQSSLVSSGMPLGAVGGALLLSPSNEWLGRRGAIIFSCFLYTVGAALEAGAISFGMMMAGRVVLGLGVGLEGGTVPVYVAECGMSLSFRIFPWLTVMQFLERSAETWSRYTSSTSPSVK